MKKTLLGLAIITSSVSSAYALSESQIQDNPLGNFYISAKVGLGFYTSGVGYSGTEFLYSPSVGYDFKGLGIPVRAELGYQVLSGAGINAYYDFPSSNMASDKVFTPYISAGIGSLGFNVGAGGSYKLNSNLTADVGLNYGNATFNNDSYGGHYSFSEVGVTIGARYTF